MNPIIVFIMVGQTVIFLAWAFVAFRALIRLNAVATERRAAEGMGPIGMSDTIGAFGDFARGRVLQHDRLLLILLSVALFATLAVRATIA
jgi:hypothetical protein